MAEPAIDGWKAIAAELGHSDRWCRMMAVRAIDPLPVFKLGGMVRLRLADLEAWIERQRAAPIARPKAVASAAVEEHW